MCISRAASRSKWKLSDPILQFGIAHLVAVLRGRTRDSFLAGVAAVG
jgi:hypothetical protein